MEEKERYVIDCCDDLIFDTEKEYYPSGDTICKTLNRQDKRIKELEEDQALLTMLISGIDNLMHDKDYRFKNDNGTWYSRQSCKDLTNEEVYQEIIDEINQLDSNFEILDKENQQLKQQLEEMQNEKNELISKYRYWRGEYYELKQQLHDLPKKIVEEIRDVAGDYWEECGNVTDLYTLTMEDFDEILDTILEEFGGEDEINND